MQLIIFGCTSNDVARIVDVSSEAVQLAVSDHGRVKGTILMTILVVSVLPETCTLIVYLTAGSAVEGLKKGHVKLEFTPVQ